jgi:hypothetical protein
MSKSFITQSIVVVGVAAMVATAATFLTSIVPEAKAETHVSGALHQVPSKGDRFSARVKGSACLHSWPNYEQGCQFDLRRPANEARTVRVVAIR